MKSRNVLVRPRRPLFQSRSLSLVVALNPSSSLSRSLAHENDTERDRDKETYRDTLLTPLTPPLSPPPPPSHSNSHTPLLQRFHVDHVKRTPHFTGRHRRSRLGKCICSAEEAFVVNLAPALPLARSRALSPPTPLARSLTRSHSLSRSRSFSLSLSLSLSLFLCLCLSLVERETYRDTERHA